MENGSPHLFWGMGKGVWGGGVEGEELGGEGVVG